MMNTTVQEKIKADAFLDSASKQKFEEMAARISEKEFSDILDGSGNQYVNFVQEGGGVWGVALVGYLCALETFGIRFLRVAGTSAGAINTTLIAALGNHSKEKSTDIREILFKWKFEEFMDGKSIVRRVASKILRQNNYVKRTLLTLAALLLVIILFPFIIWFFHIAPWLYLIPFFIFILLVYSGFHYYNLFKRHRIGLNPGNEFERQLTNVLDGFGMARVSNLNEEYNKKGRDLKLNYRYGNGEEYYNTAIENIKNIHVRELANIDLSRFRFFLEAAESNDIYKENPFVLLRAEYALITTDINAKIKVEFPKMANLYWTNENLSEISPAKFVRASMSVPFFFEPMVVSIDAAKKSIAEAWKFWLNAEPSDICTEGVLVDGGSISNFPIDIFHESDIFYPRIPVFGVRLTDRSEQDASKGSSSRSILQNPGRFLMRIFDTLKGYNDKNFLTKYTFYNKFSVQYVDCSPSNWLNFFMADAEKRRLYNTGFRAGLDYLEGFNWNEYKYERMLMALKEKNIFKQEAKPNVG